VKDCTTFPLQKAVFCINSFWFSSVNKVSVT
jgi:hypothetical protein